MARSANRPRRTYTSARRTEQALETRRQIVDAARRLFSERGYAGATIEAIAHEARVAPETVYAAFGSKRAILARLLQVLLEGDEQGVPILQQRTPQEVARLTDQSRQLELFARDMHGILSRVAPLFDVMRAAAKTEPDIAEMLDRILRDRAESMMFVVRALRKNGPLREGLSPREAADTIWALTSAELFSLLTAERGWPADRYQRWLADSLQRLLLP